MYWGGERLRRAQIGSRIEERIYHGMSNGTVNLSEKAEREVKLRFDGVLTWRHGNLDCIRICGLEYKGAYIHEGQVWSSAV